MTGPAPTHVIFKDDPGGGGCDANGNCGSGGTNGGPGGGPGGQGCVPGVGCGTGGLELRARAGCPAAPAVCRVSGAAPATRK